MLLISEVYLLFLQRKRWSLCSLSGLNPDEMEEQEKGRLSPKLGRYRKYANKRGFKRKKKRTTCNTRLIYV